MNDVSVIKHRTILNMAHQTKYGVLFNHLVEEGEDRDYTSITLDTELWIAMGKTTEITVTVEPGDLLNVPVEEPTVEEYKAGAKDNEMFTDITSEAPSNPPKVDYRSASSGRFVTEEEAKDNPDTTVAETN